jgi:hypothetical protein
MFDPVARDRCGVPQSQDLLEVLEPQFRSHLREVFRIKLIELGQQEFRLA